MPRTPRVGRGPSASSLGSRVIGSVGFSATSAGGATTGCSSGGSVRLQDAQGCSASCCGPTVILLPSSVRSIARPWTAERRSHRDRPPDAAAHHTPAFNNEQDGLGSTSDAGQEDNPPTPYRPSYLTSTRPPRQLAKENTRSRLLRSNHSR